jgi:hypothetical protein
LLSNAHHETAAGIVGVAEHIPPWNAWRVFIKILHACALGCITCGHPVGIDLVVALGLGEGKQSTTHELAKDPRALQHRLRIIRTPLLSLYL